MLKQSINRSTVFKWVLPTIHVFVSLICSHFVFKPTLRQDLSIQIPISDGISDKTELYVTCFVSLLFAVAIIFLVWCLIWKICNKEFSTNQIALFGTIFVVGVIFVLVLESVSSFV